MVSNAAENTIPQVDLSEFDWLQVRDDVNNQVIQDETAKDKFMRKFNDNPFVPIGCLATFGALSYGLWSFRTGKRRMSQYMMRLRIVAQGFTVAALIGGIAIAARDKK
ncbi:hypothetical protein B566_EDAN007280 [Ephemera danica]|nr:hypothetical protein B566_EDAN007280 [Ephemera danica]